ncbi:Endophilin-B1, partial [Ilyodon furcidens]
MLEENQAPVLNSKSQQFPGSSLLPPNSFPSSFSNNNQSSLSGGAGISVPTIPVSASLPSVSAGHTSSAASGGFSELRSSNSSRKARVLYDYDAANSSELSLLADE